MPVRVSSSLRRGLIVVAGGSLALWISVRAGAVPIGGLVLSAARDLALLEVAPGRWTVWTNASTGRTSIWANLSGVLVDLLNAPAF